MRLNSLNSNTDENRKGATVATVDSNTDKNIDQDSVPTVEKENVETSGMTLAEKIEHWKEKYKKIYRTDIDGVTFIWKRINRAEYSKCAFKKFSDDSKIDMFEKQYLFCEIGVLYPENAIELMNESAGIAPILADEIIYKSGFGDAFPKTTEVEDVSDIEDSDNNEN